MIKKVLILVFCFVSTAHAAAIGCALLGEDPKVARARVQNLMSVLSNKVFDSEEAIETAVIAMILGEPVILEGPPGLGKTTLAKAVAELFGVVWAKVQVN